MNRFLTAAAMLAAVGATPAHAVLDISFQTGATVVTCADNSGCDLNPVTGNLQLSNFTIGAFSVTGTVAESVSGSVNTLSASNLTITNNGAATASLEMVAGATGFASPVTSVAESASLTFLGDSGQTSTLSFFGDAANGQPGGSPIVIPGVGLFSVSGTASGATSSFSGDHLSVFDATAPFSMTEVADLSLLAGAQVTGFNEAMSTSVPEASTWAMMVVGFAGLGFLGLKRRSRRGRLAAFA